MNTSDDILSFIPQREPFVMIDTLLFADETTARTNFTISADNIFCTNNEFSEAGLMENIAQTVAVGAGRRVRNGNKEVSVGYIGAVKNFEIFSLPKINDVLLTEVVVTDTIFNMINVKGNISCNGSQIAQCEMKVFTNSIG
ncbi:MAG: 3-hydroxyacyl-ACP dehydratase [Parafilimonas sp.]